MNDITEFTYKVVIGITVFIMMIWAMICAFIGIAAFLAGLVLIVAVAVVYWLYSLAQRIDDE